MSAAVHPPVRVHPDTGRKALYPGRPMTRFIVGMTNGRGEKGDKAELFIEVEGWRKP